MRRRSNPAPGWVRDVLTDNRAAFGEPVVPVILRLAGRVPPTWLPARHGNVLDDELGCGIFGCVLATNDPHVVLKLSADEDEAVFVAWTLSLAGEAPTEGIVRYLEILGTEWTYGIPYYDEAARERAKRDPYASPAEPLGYTQERVYLIWRERALHVGVRSMRTRPPEPQPPVIVPPAGLARTLLEKEWREHEEGWGGYALSFEEFLARKTERTEKLMADYQAALERWRTTRWFTSDEIRVARELWEFGVYPYYRAARAIGKLQKSVLEGKDVSERDLALAHGRVSETIEDLERGFPAGRWIAHTLRALYDHGVVLRDLHEGNMGLVVRDGEERWVVTDPSQALFLEGKPQVAIKHA
jgi:hypothetical protein